MYMHPGTSMAPYSTSTAPYGHLYYPLQAPRRTRRDIHRQPRTRALHGQPLRCTGLLGAGVWGSCLVHASHCIEALLARMWCPMGHNRVLLSIVNFCPHVVLVVLVVLVFVLFVLFVLCPFIRAVRAMSI